MHPPPSITPCTGHLHKTSRQSAVAYLIMYSEEDEEEVLIERPHNNGLNILHYRHTTKTTGLPTFLVNYGVI